MEENQPKTGKFALTYGLILGAISVAFGIILYSMDMHYQGGTAVWVFSLLLMVVLIVLGMLQFKKANNGYMSFGQAMKVGVGISLVGGIIGLLFNQLMMHVIDPDLMSKAMTYQRDQLIAAGDLTVDQIDQQMEMGKKFATPMFQIGLSLIGSIFFGFLFSLIPALALKKTENLN